MADRLVRAYRRLPPPLRSAAATAQGARLRWWRYGRGSDALVAEALDREGWDEDRWRSWQAARLAEVLDHARAQVPWHRQWWQAQAPVGADPTVLADWPVLTKAQVQEAGDDLVADGRARRTYRDRTSGTTGTPLTTVASRVDLQRWFALHEARTRRWHGVSRHDRWALLGGQVVVPGDQDRPPFWVHNHAGHQLYLSAQHVSVASAPAYAEALRRHRPTHLVAYPSTVVALARAIVEAGEQPPGPALVVANAEGVGPGQRDVVREGLGATVRETYGMAEMAGGASECEQGRVHWWPDAGVLEVLDEHDRPVPAGEEGRVVLTGLVAETQAFVRYDVGDRGRGLAHGPCPCGRGLPHLLPLEGRSQDVLVLPDGRQVFWMNPIFYDLPVVAAQVRQPSTADVEVLVVPAAGWTERSAATVAARARERLGSAVVVQVRTVEQLVPGPSGKVRPIVSEVARPG